MPGKMLVLFGAGASYDVAGPGTDILNDRLRPPLAGGLFSAPLSPEILRRYPGAATLAQRIAGTSGVGLEQTLRAYADHHNPDVRDLFKEVPPYLRDLLARASWEYVRYPTSYSSFIVAAAGETEHEITVVTLNYDRLFEQALVFYDDRTYAFSKLDDYCDESREVRIVKAHGSVDWLRPIPAANDWRESVRDLDLARPYSTDEIFVFANPQATVDITQKNYHWYPVLTAPLAGKDSSHLVCPRQHLDHLRRFAGDVDKILFVGTSGYDVDVFDVITEALPADWNGQVQHVGLEQGDNLDASIARIETRIPQTQNHRQQGHYTPWKYSDGFSRYSHSDEMMKFLAV